MSNWPIVPIGQLFRLKQGTYLKPEEMAEEPTESFPYAVYGANGVIGHSSKRMYSERTSLVSCRGANCGVVHFTSQNVWISNNSIACIPISEVDPTFYYYVFLNTDFSDVITGSAQPQITITNLSSKQLIIPPLPEQKRIAGILSAYDELIENSQRRIKVLETMARNLYREWFVHYRYPGHENTPLIPSSLGEIPENWEVKKLGEIVELKSGFAFKSGTFTADGEHRLITIKNVQDGAFNPVSESRMNELPERLPEYCILKDGDILLSLTGNVGRVCLVYDGPFLLNQRVSKLAPIEAIDWALTYCMFRESDMRTKLEQLSNGVAQQNLSPVLAARMESALPPRALREQFSIRATPMIQRVIQLYSQIQNLRKTRDLLLPRLLSGQIAINTHATQAA
jgi:type I restriction enzyme S subunit